MTDIQDEKKSVRKLALAARALAFERGLDHMLNTHLLDFLADIAPSRIVAGYMPIRTEASPLPAMNTLCERGHRLCVPVVQGADQPLVFCEWTPETELVEGAFGARIPMKQQVLVPDIVVVPMVAFDAAGSRLGYGGGFYDRSLAQITEQKPVHAVGFAYSAQEVPGLPNEPTDFPLDGLVTELGPQVFK